MTTRPSSPDRLYELLPATYRISDAASGEGLRALLRLVTGQADQLRDDVQQLWDDFFIETSQRWVIPYIGDLVGNIPLHDLDVAEAAGTAESLFTDLTGPDLATANPVRLRADVAKTIHYRRRKGTPAMPEELARDVTGWDTHLVEFFTLLDWNQHLEHLRPDCHACPDLRSVDACYRTDGPWDQHSHTAEVRPITWAEGWHNIPNLGFFLWRLVAQPRTRTVPRQVPGGAWKLTFSPLGHDLPLWSAGDGPLPADGRSSERTVDTPLRPAAFFEDAAAFYGKGGCARLLVEADGIAVPCSEIACANLEKWSVAGFAQPTGTTIRIDPALGRLALPTGRNGQQLRVHWCEGSSGDLGGGEYARGKWLAEAGPPVVAVIGGGTALDTALSGRAVLPGTVIEVNDNLTYDLTTDLTLRADEELTIQAGDGFRPHVRLANGVIAVLTTTPKTDASLTLNGLLVEGGLKVDGDLRTLRLLHTTLVPGRFVVQGPSPRPSGPSVVVAPGPANARRNTQLEVEVAFSVVGALRIPEHVSRLWLLDSIVDGIEKEGDPKATAISDAAGTSGPPAHVERCTVFGESRFFQLELASESLFTGRVRVERTQAGCVRFSFVPWGSRTPRQYRCQPDLEIAQLKAERRAELGTPLPPAVETEIEDATVRWLKPTHGATAYGRPDYAQLRTTSSAQLRTGAADGSEMGVFCLLKQPQREANLRLRLEEYLPIGLEAALIYET